MATFVNMLDAKTSLSRLVHDIESGVAQEFIIARNGRPAAQLVPLAAAQTDRNRRLGVAKGRFKVPADIDARNQEVGALFRRCLTVAARAASS